MSKSKLHVARPSEHTVLPAKHRRSLRLYGTPPYYDTKIINEIIKRYLTIKLLKLIFLSNIAKLQNSTTSNIFWLLSTCTFIHIIDKWPIQL